MRNNQIQSHGFVRSTSDLFCNEKVLCLESSPMPDQVYNMFCRK